MELKENQMEMCRFYLREGSALRDTYKNFSDMSTEYDTLNLIHAAVAGVGEQTLHPKILMQFANELSKADGKENADFAFYYTVENSRGRMERRSVLNCPWDKGRFPSILISQGLIPHSSAAKQIFSNSRGCDILKVYDYLLFAKE